jgi:hypothetical protein
MSCEGDRTGLIEVAFFVATANPNGLRQRTLDHPEPLAVHLGHLVFC